ncbi:MAG: SDR family NAD(P)-dependent oxidoreductase [Brevinema sp.]
MAQESSLLDHFLVFTEKKYSKKNYLITYKEFIIKKVVLITGASSGIGYNIAITLARQGFQVYALARRTLLMENLKTENIIPMMLDITSSENIQSVVQEILAKEQKIDVLINNAGYGFYGALEEDPIQKGRDLFEVNLFGLMEMTQAVLPSMRQQKNGVIINISSVVGKVAFPYMGWYSASKFAVEGLSDALRLELKPFNTKVVLIEPGRVESEFGHRAFQLSDIQSDSPYQEKKVAFQHLVDTNPIPSDKSESISNTVLKILKTPNPHTRYLPNLDGKLAVFLKKWLGDKIIDWGISFRL